jgi:hypothetical protein
MQNKITPALTRRESECLSHAPTAESADYCWILDNPPRQSAGLA